MLVNALGCLCMGLAYVKRKRSKITELGPIPWTGIFLVTAALIVPVAALSFLLIGDVFNELKHSVFLINCMVSFGVVAVCEELLFREFLTVRMKSIHMPAWLIVLLPAFLFSLCHRPESVSLLIQRFILGVALSFLYRKKGLLLCIPVHWTYNIIIYTFHTTLPHVTLVYGAPHAALHTVLSLLLVLGMVIVFYSNRSIFA